MIDRMLYVAMSGAKETMVAQANTAHNLANANTPGFLADLNQFRSMPVFGDGHPTRVFALDERPAADFNHGSIVPTGRDLDVAVKGGGWIAVQGPDGNEAYTRRGDLVVDQNGMLTTGNGLPVIGNGGPIVIPPAGKIDIGTDGTISVLPLGQQANELAIVDRIKLVNPPLDRMQKSLDGLMRYQDGVAEADADQRLASGSLESSNVSVVDQLVGMIELSRRYEMQVKAMKTAEENASATASLLRPV